MDKEKWINDILEVANDDLKNNAGFRLHLEMMATMVMSVKETLRGAQEVIDLYVQQNALYKEILMMCADAFSNVGTVLGKIAAVSDDPQVYHPLRDLLKSMKEVATKIETVRDL